MERSLRSATWLLFLFLALAAQLTAQAAGKPAPGASIFKAKCTLCHGPDGSGNTALGKQMQAANLRSKEVQKLSDVEMRKIVHDGQANMPGFSDQLNSEEIGHVVRYIRALVKTTKQ
ncbi:MAG: cytochrome c [Acidobacteria bacterium]|nr:cytochrome c [Acidobacteriota bacterium]